MNIELDKIIPTIVEAMLPRFSHEKLGLVFFIDCAHSLFKKDETIDARTNIAILVNRSSNYTKVFSLAKGDGIKGFSGSRAINLLEENSFTIESDHDSCWRTDGFSFLRKIETFEMLNCCQLAKSSLNPSFYINISEIKFVELEYITPLDEKQDRYKTPYKIKCRRIDMEKTMLDMQKPLMFGL